MIESIEFINYKALHATTLSLAPFTLLLGPNGSGKSSVLHALRGMASLAAQQAAIPQHDGGPGGMVWPAVLSVTAKDRSASVEIRVHFRSKGPDFFATFRWDQQARQGVSQVNHANGNKVPDADARRALTWLARMQVFALDPFYIAQPVTVSGASLLSNGGGLAAVLDDLKDNYPERWDALLAELCRWLPEYDHILFDRPQQGQKGIALRTKQGGHRIPAKVLSQGTLVALALLTLAYLPDPPSVIGLEEIDRGLHPRLLRHLQDALYRLSYPESCGETRPPIQVIATTHSPYLLDLYREHPEEVVLAQKEGLEVEMKRLTDIEHYQEILGDSSLSEVWYSGILGGASVKP